jgi:hypothetical protein
MATWHRRSESPGKLDLKLDLKLELPPGVFLRRRHRSIPQTFQIAAPERPDPSTGSIAGIWVWLRFAASAQIRIKSTGDEPIPGPAIPRRLVNPGGFDKALVAGRS